MSKHLTESVETLSLAELRARSQEGRTTLSDSLVISDFSLLPKSPCRLEDCFVFLVCRSGRLSVADSLLKAGQMRVVPPGSDLTTPRSAPSRSQEESEGFFVCLRDEALLTRQEREAVRLQPVFAYDPHRFLRLTQLLADYVRSESAEAVCAPLLRAWLEAVKQRLVECAEKLRPVTREERYRKFLALVAKHAARHHDVQFYAAELCIGAIYLHRIVTEMSKRSPKAIIDERLAELVRERIVNSDESRSALSREFGFDDTSHFTRFIKRHLGQSFLEARNGRK